MEKWMKKNLEELYIEIDVLDRMLEALKVERDKSLEEKKDELDAHFINEPDKEEVMNQKTLILEKYKEQLNEELQIDDLRQIRKKIKSVIEEKQKQKDAEVAEAFSQR